MTAAPQGEQNPAYSPAPFFYELHRILEYCAKNKNCSCILPLIILILRQDYRFSQTPILQEETVP